MAFCYTNDVQYGYRPFFREDLVFDDKIDVFHYYYYKMYKKTNNLTENLKVNYENKHTKR